VSTIIPELVRQAGTKYQSKVIGNGNQKSRPGWGDVSGLPICFRAPVTRDQLIKECLSTDILFLHLSDYSAFGKVLPSKIF